MLWNFHILFFEASQRSVKELAPRFSSKKNYERLGMKRFSNYNNTFKFIYYVKTQQIQLSFCLLLAFEKSSRYYEMKKKISKKYHCSFLQICIYIKWVMVFKNGPSKICGREPLKNWSDMVCLSRPYHFKIFKGCLPQILLGPFLNTHI